jgi:hypothetical protein
MALKGNPADWSATDRQGVIYAALAGQGEHVHVRGTIRGENGKSKRKCPTCRAAARELFDRVGTEPLIYKRLNGETLPKGKDRWERFMNNVGEIHAYMVARSWTEAPETVDPASDACGGCENGECDGCGGYPCCDGSEAPSEAPETTEAPVPAPTPVRPAPTPTGVVREAERYYKLVQSRRAFVRARKLESLDSMRIVIDGARAIMAGIPCEALISAIEAPWPVETRGHAAAYRPSDAELIPPIPAGTYDYARFAPRPSKFAHATSEYVARLVGANVPVWLHGPAGTGKSTAAKYAAKTAGIPYYEVNLSGAMVSAIKGKDRLKEFVESEAMLAFEKGGLLCLEEFSGAHPSVGTALNTMLATAVGETFSNDAAGRKYVRHPDFRVVVTDNSLGYGSAEFKRSALDAATIDRFRAGRVYQGLDLGLERAIFENIIGV